MRRRDVLAGTALVAGAACAPATTRGAQTPETFVLVHGTWHGAWEWRDVRNILQDAGHRVFTPTCTGCGEREHLSHPDVGLETHIQDILNVIKFEELDNIILVGHSFAGVTITGVADRIKDKIKHIVFFDAIVPSKTRRSGVPREPNGDLPDWFKKRAEKFVDGYKMDMWEEYPIEMLVPEDSPKVDRIRRLITTHPAKQWTDELQLSNDGWKDLPRSFIHCVGQKYRMSSEKMVGPAREPGWNFIELDIVRDGMITDPDIVAETFLKISTLDQT